MCVLGDGNSANRYARLFSARDCHHIRTRGCTSGCMHRCLLQPGDMHTAMRSACIVSCTHAHTHESRVGTCMLVITIPIDQDTHTHAQAGRLLPHVFVVSHMQTAMHVQAHAHRLLCPAVVSMHTAVYAHGAICARRLTRPVVVCAPQRGLYALAHRLSGPARLCIPRRG